MNPYYDHNGITIYHGDCRTVMGTLAASSVDAIVTDPPYGLEFMGVAWDTFNTPKGKGRMPNEWGDFGSREHARHPSDVARIMWNKGIALYDFSLAWAIEALRVAKPGAHLLAFGGTRTHHRLTCAIEVAGWEVRDCVMWVYGSGFPKSLDVSKAIDKAAGVERKVGRKKVYAEGHIQNSSPYSPERSSIGTFIRTQADERLETNPTTAAAKQWSGWGTALKPAWEPIIVARKPLEGTVAQNVQKWGVGAMNIDGCRVGFASKADEIEAKLKNQHADFGSGPMTNRVFGKYFRNRDNYSPTGRWPANLIHDGSEEVVSGFPQTGPSRIQPRNQQARTEQPSKGAEAARIGLMGHNDDGGSASRFFYTAKASRSERGEGNNHPTVKPLALMEYLIKLVTQDGAVVFDPFAGSGSTLVACKRLFRRCIGMEMSEDYCEIASKRVSGEVVQATMHFEVADAVANRTLPLL